MKGSIRDKWVLYLGSVFLIILAGFLIFDISRRGIYNSKLGINVAVVGENGASLLLLRPEEGLISWVPLPSDARVEIYNSDAKYPITSLWKYGVGERKPFETIERSLGQTMGVAIARTIHLEKKAEIEDVLGKILSLGLRTDLSIRDRVLMRKFLADAVKSKKFLELTLPETVFEKVTDPDGKEFREFNSTMTLWARNKFVLEGILNENADISVNNVSSVSGAGSVLALQMESCGMHVVEVKAVTEENVPGKKCVFYSGKKYPLTEQVMVDQLGCTKISRPGFVENDDRMMVWVKD